MTTTHHITLTMPAETLWKILGEYLKAHHFPHMTAITGATLCQVDTEIHIDMTYETDEEGGE